MATDAETADAMNRIFGVGEYAPKAYVPEADVYCDLETIELIEKDPLHRLLEARKDWAIQSANARKDPTAPNDLEFAEQEYLGAISDFWREVSRRASYRYDPIALGY